jgi:hypothetical protein
VNTRSFGEAARFSYIGLQYNTADSDPVPPTVTAGAEGTDPASKIQDTIERMINSAKLNGMSSVGLIKARELLQDFREIFRIRLGSDPPANIPPLKVQLKPHFAPAKHTQRRCAPAQRASLSTAIKTLDSLGAVRVQTHKQRRWRPVCHTSIRCSSPSKAANALEKSIFVMHIGNSPLPSSRRGFS